MDKELCRNPFLTEVFFLPTSGWKSYVCQSRNPFLTEVFFLLTSRKARRIKLVAIPS